ncbi:MAG TPA: hypothetical protein VN888_03810 [Mycobacterium sp.]|nr:hypothetical protein [Mycobacterium sp.]
MAKRDRDRDDLWPASPRYAIEIAHQLREEVVGEQFLDEQLQERPRAVELRRACGKQPHGTGAHLLPPSLRIELLFRPCGVFELTVDVRD